MSAQDDLLGNPRELFERAHLFIVHSDTDADDLALAKAIADYCENFTRPRFGTLAELKKRSIHGQAFPGITLLIISPAMLADPSKRSQLVKHMVRAYQQQIFRHYCVCRDVSAEELRAYPELESLLDNVMAGDTEKSVRAILEEIYDFATRGLPNSPQLANPISSMLYQGGLRRTLAAFALGVSMLVAWASLLAFPAAIGLGVLSQTQTEFWGTGALVTFTAFFAGFRLNHLQCADMWPWLRERWKLPHNIVVDPRRPPKARPIAIGPFSLASLAVAIYYLLDAQWAEAGICAIAGEFVQSQLDRVNKRHIARRFALAADAERALKIAEAANGKFSRLSSYDCYFAAGGVVSAFYGGALISAALSAFLLAPAYLAAQQLGTAPVTWIAVAALAGFLLPAVLEEFAHSGIRYLGEYAGLSSAKGSLYKVLSASPSKSASMQGIPAGERPLVETFPNDERKLIVQWLASLRIGLRPRTYRRWRPAVDHAFVSYAWKDDNQAGAATALADACKAIGLDVFLDKVTHFSKEGVFRMPIAAGLSKSTHFFLVVTPGIASGSVVRREIEMAMGRWRGELLPAIICVVEPEVRVAILADPAMPLSLRFLLTFCPNMTPAEAAQPELIRYIVELTRRGGKWSDWRLLFSPASAMSQVIRLAGIYEPDKPQPDQQGD